MDERATGWCGFRGNKALNDTIRGTRIEALAMVEKYYADAYKSGKVTVERCHTATVRYHQYRNQRR